MTDLPLQSMSDIRKKGHVADMPLANQSEGHIGDMPSSKRIILMNKKACPLLAENICAIFREGLKVGDDLLHYIDSTFSNPSAESLSAILSDESDCESDSLKSLIFFPDEPFQTRLEEFLEKEDFQKSDENETVKEILALSPEILLCFPDKRGILKVPLSESDADRFVSRLNISRKNDKRLIRVLNHHASETCRDILKVKLRNARFIRSENKILFLCDFFEKSLGLGSEIVKLTDFILGFLDELVEDRDIFQALEEKKKLCFQHLQQQSRFEEQIKKNTMETLISQGMRIPYINKEAVSDKIAMIEVIVFWVFGRISAEGFPCCPPAGNSAGIFS